MLISVRACACPSNQDCVVEFVDTKLCRIILGKISVWRRLSDLTYETDERLPKVWAMQDQRQLTRSDVMQVRLSHLEWKQNKCIATHKASAKVTSGNPQSLAFPTNHKCHAQKG